MEEEVKKVLQNIIIKTKQQIDGIRESGKRNIEVLDTVADKIQAGMTTEEVNQIVYGKTRELDRKSVV